MAADRLRLYMPRHVQSHPERVEPRRSTRARAAAVVGVLLLLPGVFGLLFLMWELWGSGLGADSQREEATQEFYANVEALDTHADASGQSRAEARTESTPARASASANTAEEIELENAVVPSPEKIAALAADDEVMALVYAPRLGEDWAAPVMSGVDPESLDRAGLGHYASTQLPGEPGNFALAGHRQTHGGTLLHQDTFVAGDLIYMHSPDGWYTYEVTETHIVAPTETEVLAPVPGSPQMDPGDVSMLTLTTCHPLHTTEERMITHAELVEYAQPDADPPEAIAGVAEPF